MSESPLNLLTFKHIGICTKISSALDSNVGIKDQILKGIYSGTIPASMLQGVDGKEAKSCIQKYGNFRNFFQHLGQTTFISAVRTVYILGQYLLKFVNLR